MYVYVDTKCNRLLPNFAQLTLPACRHFLPRRRTNTGGTVEHVSQSLLILVSNSFA